MGATVHRTPKYFDSLTGTQVTVLLAQAMLSRDACVRVRERMSVRCDKLCVCSVGGGALRVACA